MISLEEHLRLEKLAQEEQSRADRIRGELAQLKKQLKEKFGCNTYKEGKKEFARRKEELQQISAKHDKELARLKEEYPHVFE